MLAILPIFAFLKKTKPTFGIINEKIKRSALREKFEYFLTLFAIKITKIFPNSVCYAFFNSLAILLFYTLASRRKIAIKNISAAYPNLEQKEATNLAKENFKSIARTLCEALLVYNDKLKLEQLFINGDEAINLVKKLSENGTRPILFTTAHFGNWEALSNYFAHRGITLLVIGREGNNKLIEQNITLPFRTKFGNELASKDSAMLNMVRHLKDGKNVGILIDQRPSAQGSLPTTFFNMPCRTATPIALLKLKFNPVVVPIFALRDKSGKYEIIIKNFDESVIKGNKNDDILAITQHINDIFEQIVRLDPSQWFWMHNRWRK